jgi:hypothetical protein
MKSSRLHLLVSSLLLAPLVVLAQSGSAIQEGTALAQTAHSGQVQGVWLFRATFPGQPGPTYIGTARFGKDGTISGTPVDQRTGGTLGEWARTGNQEFAFVFVADTFDRAGNFVNTHRVHGMLTVGDDGLSATGKTILEILDTTGKVIFTSPAPTAFTGERLTLQLQLF